MNPPKTESSARRIWQGATILGLLLFAAAVVVACSSMTSSSGTGMGTVSVLLSDPATCQAPNGPFAHVYVTITDVQANQSATAGDNDSGWTDLTPSLSKAPAQVDLLGLANNQCFLATMGDALQLQQGSYQQIRVLLAPNSGTLYGANCGNANNCVVLTADNSVHALALSSEAQTGIKIPSGQISGGSFTIGAGQTKDLDIDFNTCVSILQEGNGQYRLKPVLHAGEVSATSSSINGTVLDGSTGNPVNGLVTVSLEQKDASGIDRVIMTQNVNADGTWVICPVTEGNTMSPYDIVITAASLDGKTMYAPTIITGVSIGSTTGTVKLNPPAPALATASIAMLTGAVNSVGSAAGVSIDVLAGVLEQVNSTWYTIPLPMTTTQTSAELGLTTVASTTTAPCTPTTADCASYTMQLPSSGAYIGVWAASGSTFAEPVALATYEVDGTATSVSTGALDCSPTELQSTPASALTGGGPFNVTVPTIQFSSCQ